MAIRVSITHRAGKRQHVVTVSGDLDMPVAGMLRQRLNSDDRADEVVLDLSEVKFIDSTGLGVIAAASRSMNSGVRQRLRVVGARPPVQHVFEAAGLAAVLDSG
jgi:anti-sigma B factor antagonist